MDDIEEIKKRKLKELQNKYQQQIENQVQQEAQMQQQIEQLEAIIRTKLTKEALQRYGNIKTADPDRAMQVLLMLAQLLQSGKADRIDDEQFKRMLMMINQGKKEIRITRK